MSKATKAVLCIATFVALYVFGRSWLAEHDANLKATEAVKAAQTDIVALTQQKAAVAKDTTTRVVVLQQQAKAVETSEQAREALPNVEAAPLNATTVPEAAAAPDADAKVAVDAVPLYQQLNVCKQTAVQLDGCTKQLDIETAIAVDKDKQIVALKAKRGFWHRVGSTAKAIGIGTAIGGAAVAWGMTR